MKSRKLVIFLVFLFFSIKGFNQIDTLNNSIIKFSIYSNPTSFINVSEFPEKNFPNLKMGLLLNVYKDLSVKFFNTYILKSGSTNSYNKHFQKNIESGVYHGYGFGIEPIYYLSKNKNISNKLIKSSYLSLEGSYKTILHREKEVTAENGYGTVEYIQDRYVTDKVFSNISYGWQLNYSNLIHLDLYVGGGVFVKRSSISETFVFPNLKVGIDIGFIIL